MLRGNRAVPREILLLSPRPIPKGGGSGPEGRITAGRKALSLFLARSNQLNLPLVNPGTSWLTFEMLSPLQIQPAGAVQERIPGFFLSVAQKGEGGERPHKANCSRQHHWPDETGYPQTVWCSLSPARRKLEFW